MVPWHFKFRIKVYHVRFLKFFLVSVFALSLTLVAKPLFAKGNKTRLMSRGNAAVTHKISHFDTLSVRGGFNVYLSQGDKPQFRIEGNEADLDQVSFEQHGKTLNLSLKKKSGFTFIDRKLDVFITTNTLSHVDLKGSVSLTGENEFHVDDLDITSRGSGRIVIGVNAQNLNVNLKGSSSVVLTGYAQHQNVSISGSGNYKANKLLSGSANVNVHGSGTAYLDVERDLNIKVYGSGNVLYKGNPSIQSQSYGSGKVKAI